MEINIDKNLLKKNENKIDLDEIRIQISSGKSILFTGAGFSTATTNLDNEAPPFSKKLAIEICKLGQFTEDEDLRYAADYYLENNDKDKLVSFLKRKFTLKEVSNEHIEVCKANWKRFYTTNYDKCIEIASSKIGRMVECIDINYQTQEYYNREKLCIHLNGSIDSLTHDSLENSYKLSTSSYISADSFTNSPWFYYFKKDLERCSAVFFVGYSLYDVEIQKILFENENFKAKTYFITSEQPDPKTHFTLSKFGTVMPIGINGFSEIIMSCNLDQHKHEYHFQSLNLYELSDIDKFKEIRDYHVETMLTYGDIEDAYIDNGISGEQRIPYLIIRDEISRIFEFTKNGKNTIIYSELGNGKSIMLKELKPYFTINSVEVYDIVDWEGDYIADFDELLKSNKKIIIILDGYERYIDLINHYAATLPPKPDKPEPKKLKSS